MLLVILVMPLRYQSMQYHLNQNLALNISIALNLYDPVRCKIKSEASLNEYLLPLCCMARKFNSNCHLSRRLT